MFFLYLFLATIAIYGIYEFIFWLTHLNPLDNNEIVTLAKKRRIEFINNYYIFDVNEVSVSKSFKSEMKPTGKMYKLNINLREIPVVAAALLKYKKHEWIILAFETNQNIEYIYLNKGINNKSVTPYLSFKDAAEFCIKNNITTILQFHNHPNSDSHQYDCTKPSDQDLYSASVFANILEQYSINLIEFVCERGLPYCYYRNYTDNIKPILKFINEVQVCNGLTKTKNYKLHKELRRISKIKYT